MSATRSTAASNEDAQGARPRVPNEPAALSVVEFVGTAMVVGLLVWMVANDWSRFVATIPDILPWLLVVAVADLMPVPLWGSVELMMSFPVLLASAFVFPGYVAGCLSLVGTLDARELKREIGVGRALFNRSNVALSVFAASWVFQSMGGGVLDWPGVLPIAAVSLVVDLLINASLAILGTRLLTGLPAAQLVLNVYGRSQPVAFIAGYACFGLLAIVLATVYRAAGAWGLVAFAIPILLARQMFVHWRSLADARHQLDEERQLLTHVSSRIADERRDERLTIAAGLHDDVLPPLFRVHLLGQVLRQELSTGQLLAMEDDLPALLRATDEASETLRSLIHSLRVSPLGTDGLARTLQLLVRQLEVESTCVFVSEIDDIRATPVVELLAYQVAREAIRNAVQHSGAERIKLTLKRDEECLRIMIEDDGRGFAPRLVDDQNHFGIALMRARVHLAGGVLQVESSNGNGTQVIARLPLADRIQA